MKKIQQSYIYAGLIFAVLALMDAKDLISALVRGDGLIWGLLARMAGYAVIAVGLFTSRHVAIFVVGFAFSLLARILGQTDLLSILACLGVLIISWCGAYQKINPDGVVREE